MAVCHDDLPVLSTPGGLHRLELDLGHHHAQRAVRPVDASGYIEAGLAADGALAEELGRALAHGVSEVRPKGVVGADEARGASIVAGGERRPAPICHIDGGGAGLSGQGFQSRIDHGARVVVRSLQQGAQRLLRGENNRSGAVTLQLAVQQGEVQRQGRPGSLTQLGLGVGSRDAPAKPHDKRDKGDRCGDQWIGSGRKGLIGHGLGNPAIRLGYRIRDDDHSVDPVADHIGEVGGACVEDQDLGRSVWIAGAAE